MSHVRYHPTVFLVYLSAEDKFSILKLFREGKTDIPFTFIHKCALTFNVGMSDLLEGQSARLSTCTVMRKGHLQDPITEDGIQIMNMAPMFRNKIAEPYWVKYEYSEELQNKPIHTTQHSGQEFDFIMSGRLKVQVGEAATKRCFTKATASFTTAPFLTA